MSTWLGDFVRALTGRVENPLYKRERGGWSYIRLWSRTRRGCLPVIIVLLLTTATCCTLPMLSAVTDPTLATPARFLIIGGTLLASIYITAEIVRAVAGLLATALTATTVSAELEGERMGVLRVTLLSAREITLAKFAAALRELRLPFTMVSLARLTILIGAILMLVGIIVFGIAEATTPTAPVTVPPISPPPAPITPDEASSIDGLGIVLTLSSGILIPLLALLWLLFFLFEPFLSGAMFAAVGLYASSLSRTRANGLISAAALRVGYWMFTYLFSQIGSALVSLLIVPLGIFSTMSGPAPPAWLTALAERPAAITLVVLLGILISTLLAISWFFVITIGLLALTTKRIRKLPYST